MFRSAKPTRKTVSVPVGRHLDACISWASRWLLIFINRLVFERPTDLAGRAGLWIFLFALAVEPLVGRQAPHVPKF